MNQTEVLTSREIKMLEFDQIRQKLAGLTVSPMGQELAESLCPSADPLAVEKLIKETSEGRLLGSKKVFYPSTAVDIQPFLSRAAKGAMLSGAELSAVMLFISAVQRWVVFFKDSDHRELFPMLAKRSAQLYGCADLFSSLKSSVDADGTVLDSASTELAAIRRKILVLQGKIRDKLDQYIRSESHRRYLQEALVTIRNGRYVLPVKQEHRQQLSGVVHDQSASGATVFIEPLPVVQLQNELISLHRQEEQEVERILFSLSSRVADLQAELTANRESYAVLDLIVARGNLSIELEAAEPMLLDQEQMSLHLINAVHPLLPGQKVPLNLKLGENTRTLVITGPNTGGKTVALKTIGLLAVMLQSGLHVPAEKNSRFTVFNKIRTDIGDEQSIAQSLSTFSGHMKNIISIIDDAGSGSLILLDELGAGTDPSEGSALAMAILDELTTKGAMTVATTHINELKLFAQVRQNMQNAAMEFDLDTLSPTYCLLQGIPGQSNAFHIAGKLGTPKLILEKAGKYLHRSHDQVESVIASLVEDQQRYSRDSKQAALERNRAEMLMAELEKEQLLLRARREDILKQAREEARQMIRQAKQRTDELIKELRTIEADPGKPAFAGAEKVRQSLNQLRRDIEPDDAEYMERGVEQADLAVGQEVYASSLKQRGAVISFTDHDALIQVGSMKVNLPLHDLKIISTSGDQKPGSSNLLERGGYSVQKELNIRSSIDLRGLNLEEARPLVDKLIDNGLWAGLNRIELIHGKGTGKLREGLREYLSTHQLVSAFRSGAAAEGGDGVTVVEIKQ